MDVSTRSGVDVVTGLDACPAIPQNAFMKPHRFAIAPMMDWTDRHCRNFHRVLTKRALLFTEMVVADAVIRGDREKLLGFEPEEHPVALQIGGSDPAKLAEAARIGAEFGYDEINLNCGCPSDRVQSGAFGACLMREPERVAECVTAMRAVVDVPVTVKCRIGVDDDDPEERLFGFVETVAAAGCEVFTVHARKAWLKGLSPKENRDVPPLDYGLVECLKLARPDLTVILNGGIATLEAARAHLEWADGVMLGRAAYQTPALLGGVDAEVFRDGPCVSPVEAVERYRPYIARELARGTRLHAITRHMLGLFHGAPGARGWRQVLSGEAVKPGAGMEVIDAALSRVRASVTA
jgi:tRNA-dihydrouridine synthase A